MNLHAGIRHNSAATVVILGDILTRVPVSVGVDLISLLKSGALVIANLEGPIVADAPGSPPSGSTFANAGDVVALLHDLNVSVVTLANNHVADFGADGIRSTVAALDHAGIRWIGCCLPGDPSPDVLELPEIEGALIAYSHHEGPHCGDGTHDFGPRVIESAEVIRQRIRQLRSMYKRVLVSYHGGEEYFSAPWPRRAAFFRSLAEAGADLVFGTHSHSIQPVETAGTSVLVYGTGNFYFDHLMRRQHFGTEEGLAVAVDWANAPRPSARTARVAADCDRHLLTLANKFTAAPLVDSRHIEGTWRSECRWSVWAGYLRSRHRPYGPMEYWKSPILPFWRSWCAMKRLVSVIRHGFATVRERDVFLSTVPFYGRVHCAKMNDEGRRVFDF
jgi:hypothetical protein